MVNTPRDRKKAWTDRLRLSLGRAGGCPSAMPIGLTRPTIGAEQGPHHQRHLAMVRRMAGGVAPGGTLFMVGHRPVDPATGRPTAAAGQVQVSVESAVAGLDPRVWELAVAEERPRAVAGTGVDAVIRARRVA